MNTHSHSVRGLAFVAILAILALLYMASLSHKAPTSQTRAGAASHLSVQESLITDGNPHPLTDDTSTQVALETREAPQKQLIHVIQENDPQRKADLAQELSRFQ